MPACPNAGCCLTGSKLGLTGGQAVSQAHCREQCLSPLISSFLLPWPEPHCFIPQLTPPTFLLGKHNARNGGLLFADKLFYTNASLSALWFCFNVCVCAKGNTKKNELWINKWWKEFSQDVKIKRYRYERTMKMCPQCLLQSFHGKYLGLFACLSRWFCDILHCM